MTALTIEMFMSPAPYTIGADVPLSHAQELMQTHRVRHLPVLEGGRLVGVLSERDLALVAGLGKERADLSVEDAMSSGLYIVPEESTLRQVVVSMAQYKHDSAVVMRDDEVIGIFTTVDACAALLHLLDERDQK